MHDVLAEIIAGVRVDLAAREAAVPLAAMIQIFVQELTKARRARVAAAKAAA